MKKVLLDGLKVAKNCHVREIIAFVQKLLGKSLRGLAEVLGEDHQKLSYWMNHAHKMKDFLTFICRLRKASRLSWNKFGNLLDDEFLTREDKSK